MDEPFSKPLADIADSMGIALYQRFSVSEAALFLRCPQEEVGKLLKERKIAYIQLPEGVEFFGFQLLEYLLGQVQEVRTTTSPSSDTGTGGERILRSQEVQELTGLSRTTIWRLERKGEFPARVPLSGSSIGWRHSEVQQWIATRKSG